MGSTAADISASVGETRPHGRPAAHPVEVQGLPPLYGGAVKTRPAVRAAVVAATLSLMLALATPAQALYRDDGDGPGPGISALETLLLYVGIPLAVFVLVALLTYAKAMTRGPRYRPDLGWWAGPVWFEGPPQGAAAIATDDTPGTVAADGGGASARW